MNFIAGSYDIAIIGGGHAGIEAALAGARLGCKTVLFSINLDAVGNMPCNPSIGGTGKGHLVREIDALGGEMGKMADKTFIQSRILNKGKGPAVYSLRVQSDRRAYQILAKHTLEKQKNLSVKQAEIVDLEINQDGSFNVITHTGAAYKAKTVIVSTGTYLRGRIILGDVMYESGPDGMFAATKLTFALKKLGIELLRFKTGTPARINRCSIDFSNLEEQKGDEKIVPFSFETTEKGENKVSCYVTYTTEKTHQIIRDNLHRSPLYSGKIEGIGPRYCPSIEDKIVRFADKERHQLFLEPMGQDTEEIYVQGFSTSLPEDVQLLMVRSLPGLENADIMRSAYAIEYDCADSTQLKHSLEFKNIPGLFGAGQFNGTSGYEEAAAQGLIAGINAVRYIKGIEPFILDRSEAYIGTLIDDLVTKGTNEPYRMMTSRSEYRLLLRQDNADLRLTPKGYEIGLISKERYEKFKIKQEKIKNEIERLKKTTLPPTKELNNLLIKQGTSSLGTGAKISELICRPQLEYEMLAPFDKNRPNLPDDIKEQVQISLKYEGYIKRERQRAEQFKKLENKRLPSDIDYSLIKGLRIEARQKLNKIRPQNLGQAGRISGVSPADISVLMIYLEQKRRQERRKDG
jgi:tRNA uridine 5-carboxymethylaminomethyl modification enzyme